MLLKDIKEIFQDERKRISEYFNNTFGGNLPDVDEFDILYYTDFDFNNIFVRNGVEFRIREGNHIYGY